MLALKRAVDFKEVKEINEQKKDACKEIVRARGFGSITKRINSLPTSVIRRRHGKMGEAICVFLTSVLAGGEWSASGLGRFTPGKELW
jgi:spore maturation protein SpmA